MRVDHIRNQQLASQAETSSKQGSTRDLLPALLRSQTANDKNDAEAALRFYDAIRRQASLEADPSRIAASAA